MATLTEAEKIEAARIAFRRSCGRLGAKFDMRSGAVCESLLQATMSFLVEGLGFETAAAVLHRAGDEVAKMGAERVVN